MASHTTNNVPRSCSNIHSFLAPPLLMCQALYAALIRFWPAFTFSSIVSRPCEGMMCVCVCGSRWWRHFRTNPHCLNQNSEHTFFFLSEACADDIAIEGAQYCFYCFYCHMQPSVVGRWRKTTARSSPPTTLMTTGPTKCVCGRLLSLRATM